MKSKNSFQNNRQCSATFLRLLLVFIVFWIAFLQSCDRDRQKMYTVDLGVHTMGEALDYLYFPKGTTWVYQNSMTGELDTQEMITCDTFKVTSENIPDPYGKPPKLRVTFTSFYSQQYSSRFKTKITNKHVYYGGPWKNTTEFHWSLEKSIYISVPTYKSGQHTTFLYPWYTSKNIWPDTTDQYAPVLVKELDTLTVQGNLYKDVKVFRTYLDGAFLNPLIYLTNRAVGNSYYYYAKGVGIIKMEGINCPIPINQYTNYNWTLISFTKP